MLKPDPEAKRRGGIQIFVAPTLKARIVATAEARGVSVSALLGELVERTYGPSSSAPSPSTAEERAELYALLQTTERDAETAALAAERATREARRLSQDARAARERLFPQTK